MVSCVGDPGAAAGFCLRVRAAEAGPELQRTHKRYLCQLLLLCHLLLVAVAGSCGAAVLRRSSRRRIWLQSHFLAPCIQPVVPWLISESHGGWCHRLVLVCRAQCSSTSKRRRCTCSARSTNGSAGTHSGFALWCESARSEAVNLLAFSFVHGRGLHFVLDLCVRPSWRAFVLFLFLRCCLLTLSRRSHLLPFFAFGIY